MSSRSEFEEFARDCVRLAGQANSPELRQKLFDIAREWMRAAMDWEEARKTTPRSRGYEASEKVKALARIEQLVDAANGREPSSLMLPENRRQVFESLENPEISS